MSPRKVTEDEIVVASHNQGKLAELRALFGDKVKKLSLASDYGLDSPPETGTTFVENALIKAQYVAQQTGKVAVADDSGICVDALDGAPGVYTADWAEKEDGTRDFGWAMDKVEAAVKAKGADASLKAHFVSCLAIAWPDGHYEIAEGYAHGTLAFPRRGTGFGFDPVFLHDGHTQTYGEMDPAYKQSINHRAEAVKKLLAKCF